MARRRAYAKTARLAAFVTEYEDQSPELVIPEDLSTLSDADLTALHDQAVANFDALYGDGSGLSAEDVETLGQITEGIEALAAEQSNREAAAAERAEAAGALAARVHGGGDETPETDEAGDEGAEGDAGEAPVADGGAEAGAGESAPALVAGAGAEGRREIRVPLGRSRARAPRAGASTGTPTRMQDLMLAADVPGSGFAAGTGLDWANLGRLVDRRLQGYSPAAYAAAARSGKQMREQHSLAMIRKPFDPDLILQSSDPDHVDKVIARAIDQSRLPGGSLVASGGWCAPSETIYSLFEMETRAGLFSLPEVGIARGGINYTPGPTFSDIYSAYDGWDVSEADDEAGDYDGEGGSKPVYTVGCPSFTEARLRLTGIAVQAGLLQQRGYPEAIARTTRGVLVAHDHKQAGRILAALVTGSTAVTMPALDAGAAAPLLEAIELQVIHTRYIHRLSDTATLEAVFPFWIKGVIRADLSRRSGQNLLDVTDAQIIAWFRLRGIAPQFVYNWQDITGAAGAFTGWPASVKFLLYPAGTWIKGGADVITLDTLYDSTLLGNNDYTALFTEEGWLTAKVGHDSRVVEVPLCASGATHSGSVLDCDGAWYGALGS